MWTHQQLFVRLALVLSSFCGTVASAAAHAPVFDCNGNGIEDSVDIATGGSRDFNLNGIPDECETDARSTTPRKAVPPACTPARWQRSADGRWRLRRRVIGSERRSAKGAVAAPPKAPQAPRRP